jgi:hypothetical protein
MPGKVAAQPQQPLRTLTKGIELQIDPAPVRPANLVTLQPKGAPLAIPVGVSPE